MDEDRKGQGRRDGVKLPANDVSPDPAKLPPEPARMATSPAFDRWLERQMKLLAAAAQSPPDPKLLEVIRQTFLPEEDEVTD